MEHFIEKRNCLHCGNTFEVQIHKVRTTSRRVEFCSECLKNTSNWERILDLEKAYPERKEKRNKDKKEYWLKNYKRTMLQKAKTRAQKRGLEFNIDESDIVIPEVCPILEVPLIIGTKGDYEYSPSLDRIDNTKGYVKGNVQVISKKANSMKNSATSEELQTFCKNILRYSLNSGKQKVTES